MEDKPVIKITASEDLKAAMKEIDAGKRPVEALAEMVNKRKLRGREQSYREGMHDEHY